MVDTRISGWGFLRQSCLIKRTHYVILPSLRRKGSCSLLHYTGSISLPPKQNSLTKFSKDSLFYFSWRFLIHIRQIYEDRMSFKREKIWPLKCHIMNKVKLGKHNFVFYNNTVTSGSHSMQISCGFIIERQWIIGLFIFKLAVILNS